MRLARSVAYAVMPRALRPVFFPSLTLLVARLGFYIMLMMVGVCLLH